MKRVSIIAVYTILVSSLHAQEMFAGSGGDGYAEATLPLQVLLSPAGETVSISLYPSVARPGTAVHLPKEIRADRIMMHNISGQAEPIVSGLSFNGFRVPEVPPGCYLVTINTMEGRIMYSKLIVQPW